MADSPNRLLASTLLVLLSGLTPGSLQGLDRAPDSDVGAESRYPQDADEPDLQPGLLELGNRMAGSFSSRAQSLEDQAFSDIRLEMVPIWPDRPGGLWFYVEQSEADARDRPYRQRVYRITTLGENQYLSQVYTLPGDPMRFAGAWRETSPLGELSPGDLTLKEGCGVVLAQDSRGDFVGGTKVGACPSTLRGAAYATTEVTLAHDRMVSWDRGFDGNGGQVWGSTSGGYVFLRTKPDSVGPVFRDGQAQVVPAFEDPEGWIREELWVETDFDTDGDGAMDRVHVAVVRPGQTKTEDLKVPVIYESSPYFSGTAGVDLSWFWNVRQEVGAPPPARKPAPSFQPRIQPGISNSLVGTWVPRGFAVVHSEAPGTGLSEGCPTIGGDPEALAPKAVIDWLNGRAMGYTQPDGGEPVTAGWSTGKVGMTGTSYNGTIPVAAATTGVEGLEAIIPVAPNTSYYRYYRSNGLVRSPGGYLGEDVDVLYDFINSGDPAHRPYCNATYRDGDMAAGQDRTTGDWNDFWAGRDFMGRVDGIRAAALMAHGLNDWNVMPEHSIRVYENLKSRGVPAMIYLHQGGHGGPPPLELMNRWFTRYLYGVQNGVENDPKAWIVRENDDGLEPTPYPDYPHPDASPVTLHPGMGGVQTGPLTRKAIPAQGTETLVDNFSFSGGTLARAEWTEHRLLYATPELTEPLHISGTPSITLRLAVNKAAANLSVWLVSLPWVDGRRPQGGLITRGWADPQNHASLTDGEPLVPGEFYEITFELQPDDQILQPGQRLGLMIFSSDREFTLRPAPGTELTVDLDGTRLELPVVGGEAALGRALGG